MLRHFVTLLIFTAASAPLFGVQGNDELIDTVIGLLTETDQEIRAIALEQIRNEIQGATATQKFAAQLFELDQAGQIGLLRALGDRGDAAARTAVVEFLSAEHEAAVRVAAITALGRLGSSEDAVSLIELLQDQHEIAAAARRALVALPHAEVSDTLVRHIDTAPSPQQIMLIEILADRRAEGATTDLLTLATGKDAKLRSAAMKALGQLANPAQVPPLAAAVLAAKLGNERNDAERHLASVCNRIEDHDQRAKPLLEAMQHLSPAERISLLPALGRIGGSAALDEISDAIVGDDMAAHANGIRGLANWPDASVAGLLIVVAEQDPHADHRRLARLTILRVAPLPDGRTDMEKLELLKTGMALATNQQERLYGLKRAAPIRLVETLRFVEPYLDQPPYAEQACQSIVELAHDRKLRDDNQAEFHAALDRVIATTKNPVLIDRANRYKRGQTWVRPK